MYIAGEHFHIVELAVWLDIPLRVAPVPLAVIDVDVDISCIPHSTGDHCVGCRADVGLSNFIGKMVPAVPTHRRRSCKRSGLRRCWKDRENQSGRNYAADGLEQLEP